MTWTCPVQILEDGKCFRQEQKPVVVMPHISIDFTSSEANVFDSNTASKPTTKACPMKQEHHGFTVYDSDDASEEKMTLFFGDTIAKQNMNQYSDIIKNADVKNDARPYL